MRTFYFFFVAAVALIWILRRRRIEPSRKYGLIDAPAYTATLLVLHAPNQTR